MTPTQLRAFAAVVRLGSVKAAAAELKVSEAAVSMHMAQLRGELHDKLFVRTAAGLAFTPGGLRLASRAGEILGLQELTVEEVSGAASGRRLLRVGTSSLFAEHAAPGLIDLFAGRAADLDVELSVRDPSAFPGLLLSRTIDVAIGPVSPDKDERFERREFLKVELVVVAGGRDSLAGRTVSVDQLREQTILLGPASMESTGAIRKLISGIGTPEDRQRIFLNEAAALEEAKRGHGIAVAVRFAVRAELTAGDLVQVSGPQLRAHDTWSALALPVQGRSSAASELLRFVTTPRATQAMLRGSGVNLGRFKPSLHVTLWS